MQRSQKTKKRYNFKSKFAKTYTRRALKKRMPFTDLAHETKVRCEYIFYVRSAVNTQSILTGSGVNFNNVTTELQANLSWNNNSADFLKYKIYAISAHASPVHSDSNVSDGASNIPISIAFYPNYVNANITNNEVMNYDSCLRVEPYLTSKQLKYWYFPDDFYELQGYGYGIWSPIQGIAGQPGQFSIGCNAPFQNFLDNKSLYIVRVCVYVKFGFKRW